ncbi:MAG: hypothetical protein ACRYFU_25260, partial [Janthinobacterium lividum]
MAVPDYDRLTPRHSFRSLLSPTLIAAMFCFGVIASHAQDPFHLETSTGAERLRLAAANFKPTGTDNATPELVHAFDTTLAADLANAGV